ncbi:nNudix hydrolase [Pycnococcus provasolii]
MAHALLAALRRRLRDIAPPPPSNGAPAAAVLVPLFRSATPPAPPTSTSNQPPAPNNASSSSSSDQLAVLLTRRSAKLRRHGGEVALPGGRLDPGETARDAALREAHEECGLPPSKVTILGELDPMLSKHKVWVTPVVGLVEDISSFKPTPNPGEVDSIFWVPLESMLSSKGHSHTDIELFNTTLRIHNFDVEVDATRIWRCSDDSKSPSSENFVIWGLTSAILVRIAMLAHDAAPEFEFGPSADLTDDGRDEHTKRNVPAVSLGTPSPPSPPSPPPSSSSSRM